MRSRGIWLTMLMRGVQLNSLTALNAGTTAPISYTQCYISGGGTLQCLSRRGNSRINTEVGNELTNKPPLVYNWFGLYAVAKLRWLVGGFAIADIARVIGCHSFGLLILKQTICY